MNRCKVRTIIPVASELHDDGMLNLACKTLRVMNGQPEQNITATPRPERPSASRIWARALDATGRLMRDPLATFPVVIDRLGERFGDAPALSSPRETYSYAELAGRTRQYARWAMALGGGPGMVIGVLMPNRPDYLAVWLGITRVGAVASLLNTELPPSALAHCLTASGVTHLVVDQRLEGRARDAAALMDVAPHIHVEPELSGISSEPLETSTLAVTLASPALHIFTSGTTGLPKAAIVSHRRVLSWAGWFAGLTGTTADDRLYNCLPMFHSVGGVVAIGSVLLNGGCVVLREKFSASAFWSDIRRENCTLFQYIGELCRYLLAAPPQADDRDNPLRLIVGNGLRAEVWQAFEQRFAPGQVIEFYAATEGTFSLYNVEGKVGAIGRFPPFLLRQPPAIIVRRDDDGIVRDDSGHSVLCEPGEAGEVLGRIDQGLKFEGYTSVSDSDSKIVRNVLHDGDAWFLTGDLMKQDAEGFFYFVDRIGDTFRWKGENVATTEVAAALTGKAGIAEACVFGVAIPGTDGRAGMAVITGKLDAPALDLTAELPAYAQPVFLRVVASLAVTDTFKHQKTAYITDGFDPALGGVYWRQTKGAYAPLDDADYHRILSGDIRL